MNKASLRICIQVFVEISVFLCLRATPVGGVAGPLCGCCFPLERPDTQFSKVALCFRSPPAKQQCSGYPTPSPALGIVSLFNFSHPSGGAVIAHVI